MAAQGETETVVFREGRLAVIGEMGGKKTYSTRNMLPNDNSTIGRDDTAEVSRYGRTNSQDFLVDGIQIREVFDSRPADLTRRLERSANFVNELLVLVAIP